jgi:hypothetical protein
VMSGDSSHHVSKLGLDDPAQLAAGLHNPWVRQGMCTWGHADDAVWGDSIGNAPSA